MGPVQLIDLPGDQDQRRQRAGLVTARDRHQVPALAGQLVVRVQQQRVGAVDLLGYYPGSLFAGGIANQVDWVGWGGEVYTGLANPCATTDQMGSGLHAADGWTRACYQRLIHNQTDLAGTVANFDGIASVDVAASGCPTNEYTIETVMNSGSNWGSYQFFGGPAA